MGSSGHNWKEFNIFLVDLIFKKIVITWVVKTLVQWVAIKTKLIIKEFFYLLMQKIYFSNKNHGSKIC